MACRERPRAPVPDAGFVIRKASRQTKGLLRVTRRTPPLGLAVVAMAVLAGSAWGQAILDDFRYYASRFWLIKPKAADLKSLVGALREAA